MRRFHPVRTAGWLSYSCLKGYLNDCPPSIFLYYSYTWVPHCNAAPYLTHRIQTLSWKPRAFVYHNFLSRMEAQHVIKLSSVLVGLWRSCACAPASTVTGMHPIGHGTSVYSGPCPLLHLPLCPPQPADEAVTGCGPQGHLSTPPAPHIPTRLCPQMKRSLVVGPNDTGVVDSIRTSAGMFIM